MRGLKQKIFFEGNFFHFEYDEADHEVAGSMISIAEDTYEEVASRFQIAVMNDTADIGISEEIAVWTAGQADPALLQMNEAPSMIKLNDEEYQNTFSKRRKHMSEHSISIPDVMYFSSPADMKTGYLSAEITGQVFMSPWIGISSLFIIDRFREAGAWFQKILSEHNLKLLSSNYNIDYDEWWISDSLLGVPLKEAHLRHNIEAFAHVPPLRSVSSGYIYKLDVSGIKEELKLYVTEDADRELVYSGKEKIPVVEKIPHTIQWELSYGGNEPQLLHAGKVTARDLASGEVREVLSSDLWD